MLARLVFSLVLGLLMYIPRPVPRPRRRQLHHMEGAASVPADDIGKGPADVDTDLPTLRAFVDVHETEPVFRSDTTSCTVNELSNAAFR